MYVWGTQFGTQCLWTSSVDLTLGYTLKSYVPRGLRVELHVLLCYVFRAMLHIVRLLQSGMSRVLQVWSLNTLLLSFFIQRTNLLCRRTNSLLIIVSSSPSNALSLLPRASSREMSGQPENFQADFFYTFPKTPLLSPRSLSLYIPRALKC